MRNLKEVFPSVTRPIAIAILKAMRLALGKSVYLRLSAPTPEDKALYKRQYNIMISADADDEEIYRLHAVAFGIFLGYGNGFNDCRAKKFKFLYNHEDDV